MNEVEYVTYIDGLHVRSEILCSVVFELAHKLDCRIWLAHVDAQKRICLVVFKKYVVSRRMLFDEVVFGQ